MGRARRNGYGYLKHDVPPPPFNQRYLVNQVSIESGSASGGFAEEAFDDNESSTWSGEWLRLNFAPQAVAEVAIRTGNMRTTSYPVTMTVGESQVFDGTIPANLGYWRLPFDTVDADTLRIDSAGDSLSITEIDIYGPTEERTDDP
jgi:hypothetical protein